MGRGSTRLRWLLTAAAIFAAEAVIASNSLPVASLPAPAEGEARAPVGWLGFCKRYPAECAVDAMQSERVTLTAQAWKTLETINMRVNSTIVPITDMEHWGTIERWDLAEDGKGDCEDFALLKRKRLVEAGLPRRALLMTVVIDEEQAGHAVLMVRTDAGDLILDNKTNKIKAWGETPYAYVKRESQAAQGWVALGGSGSAVATAAP
jgi:predicted transglutaminase-like cysteine proteinase